jgi:RNA polymerase sigma-70 factor (ECF subfamily)
MADESGFAGFLRRIRAGDDEAAAELVRTYGAAIRLEIQMAMRDTRLRRAFDASDVCQSVFASFFLRAASGQFDLETSAGLSGLLVQMARNKLRSSIRRYTSTKRDVRRTEAERSESLSAASGPTPSREIEFRELLQQFRNRLTPEEQRLAEARAEGRPWDSIGTEMREDPRTLCKRLERAVDRVCRELGLDES